MLLVGGNWNNGSNAGVRAANANNSAGNSNTNIGFRLSNCVLPVIVQPRLPVRAHTHHTQILIPSNRDEHQTFRRQPVAIRANVEAGAPYMMPTTYARLYKDICSFEQIYSAYERARLGKRYRQDVLEFSVRLGDNLLKLQGELCSFTWQPGPYREMIVHEPKPRMIRVAPFRDRIVHQALCAVIAPLFEETFLYDSYACRVGKGTHHAVDRLTAFLRKAGGNCILKGDLSKFFDSIPHGLIMRELEWRIADGQVLELCRKILGTYESSFEGPPGFGPRGVPIGNLTSQWFANIVGNILDQYIKHELRCKLYLRYMDDFLLIAVDKDTASRWLHGIQKLLDQTGLVLNPKTRIMPSAQGVPFLGYRIWADHRRVLRDNVVSGHRRMRRDIKNVRAGELDGSVAVDSLRSWFAHLAHADTYSLRKSLWNEARSTLEEYL